MTVEPAAIERYLSAWGSQATFHTDRDAWAQSRRLGLGASAIASILPSVKSYGSPWSVWIGLHHPHLLPAHSEATLADFARGHALEAAALTLAERHIGATIIATDPSQVVHPIHDWARCSPDGVYLAADGAPAGLVEAKTTRHRADSEGWPEVVGSISLDLPRADWIVQVAWQMIVTGARSAYLVILGPTIDRLTVVRVELDEDELTRLLHYVAGWWAAYGSGLDCPPSDGSDACRRYWLTHPRGPGMIEAEGDDAALLAAYITARAEAADLTARSEAAKVAIIARLGSAGAQGMFHPEIGSAKLDKRGALRLTTPKED
jgi:predicted phage-related endonuclease